MPAVALRLPHVLALMALLLAAGVLSVRTLPDGSFVQGTVVIAVAGLTAAEAQQLQRERGDLRWAVVPAADGPLAPFDEDLVQERLEGGAVAALFVQPPQPAPLPASWREAWRVVVAPDSGDAVGSLERFARAQSGTRPFLAGLILPPRSDASEAASPLSGVFKLLDRLVAATEGLPAYRRTSIVLLGDRRPGTSGRVVARLDRGSVQHAAPATLTDLLEPAGAP